MGAFRSKENAFRLGAGLKEEHGEAQIHQKETAKGPIYFVVAGCYSDKAEASALLQVMKDQGQEGFTTRARASQNGPIVGP